MHKLKSIFAVLIILLVCLEGCKHDVPEVIEIPEPAVVQWPDLPSSPCSETEVNFKNDILKLMVTKCAVERLDNYSFDGDTESGCHSSEDRKNGIALDTYSGIFDLIDGKTVWEDTKLYEIMVDKDVDKRMPISGVSAQLTDDEMIMLKSWVESGAPENSPCNPCIDSSEVNYVYVRNLLYKNCSGCHNDELNSRNSAIFSMFTGMGEGENSADSLRISQSIGIVISYMEKIDNPMPLHIGRLYRCEVEALKTWNNSLK